MSKEANEIARKLICDWQRAAETEDLLPTGALDDLHGRVATALDESWQQGLDDAKMDRSLRAARTSSQEG